VCGDPPAACAPGSAYFVGDPACTPVGPPGCTSGFATADGGWGCAPVVVSGPCTAATFEQLGATTCVPVDDCTQPFPPAAATYFVSASYTASQIDASHFQHIADAIAAAPAGATIAIDAGTYTEALTPTQPVTLVGRCAEMVTLSGTTADTGVTVAGTQGVALSHVTITGFEPGVMVSGGGGVTLTSSIVSGNAKAGVIATDQGTTVSIQSSALRSNVPDETMQFGYGIAVGFNAAATITSSTFTDNGEAGVFAEDGGTATVSRSIVRRSKPRAGNNAYGWGIGVQGGGSLDVTECDIEDVLGGGVVAVETGSSATVTRTFTAATLAGAVTGGTPVGGGVLVQLSATATVTGSTLSDSEVAGLYVSDKASATLTDSAIIGVRTGTSGLGGIVVGPSGTITTQGSVVANNAQIGTLVSNPGKLGGGTLYMVGNSAAGLAVDGQATLSRFRVSQTANAASAGTPYGAGVFVSGTLTADHGVVQGSPGLGIVVAGKGATATLSDLVVRDTSSLGDASGFGLAVASGASATVTNAALVGNRDVSLYVSDPGTTANLSFLTVANTTANGPEGRGRGVDVQSNATAQLQSVAVLNSTEVSVDVTDGATLVMQGSLVSGSAMSVNGFGDGVSAVNTGLLMMTGTVVENASSTGLVFGAGTGGVVASSVVASNAIGIYTQMGTTLEEASTEPASVMPGVVVVTTDTQFVGNQQKVGSQQIPLPSPVMKSL
jgi:hypothetical protein